MGRPISVVLFQIYARRKRIIVIPSQPLFYKHYVDGTYVRRKKNDTDELYNVWNSYQQNIKPTLELDPIKFLYTEINLIRSNDKIVTQVCTIKWKSSLYIGHQKSQWAIHNYTELTKLLLISTLKRIINKYIAAEFPTKFVFFIIHDFDNDKDDLIIPQCDALRDLVPFVQFKKRKKHPWRSVNSSKVADWSLQLY